MIYLEEVIPLTHLMLLGNGMTGSNIGWPTSPETECLRAAWLDAPDLPARKGITEQLQGVAGRDVYAARPGAAAQCLKTRPSPGC